MSFNLARIRVKLIRQVCLPLLMPHNCLVKLPMADNLPNCPILVVWIVVIILETISSGIC